VFQIVREKKRKVVLLPWEELRKALRGIQPTRLPDYKNLRARILFQGHEILSGARLSTVLSMVDKLHPEKGIVPAGEQRSYRYPDEVRALAGNLGKLLRLCPRKKKSRKLGFLALYVEDGDAYHLRTARSYNAALLDSVAALEDLDDRLAGTKNTAAKKKVAAAYHRLIDLVDS